ncbi:hypothetical protein IJH02_03705 [Candidatus Saccharibacteria bacterium]|nr:hypothetical protein [Candidatus Saccharibacteria bacterium]
MENGQNPGFIPQPNQPQPNPQPNTFATGQFQSAQATTPVFNAGNAIPQVGNNAVSAASPISEDRRPLTFIVIIVIVSLIAVTFVGLFIWMASQYSSVSSDVNGQIKEAVAVAVNENTEKLESDFAEREKSPYKTFSGPADYGELSFKYPKTWSVYIAKDTSASSSSGDFEAYLNPDVVQPISNETINALRVTIKNSSYDTVAKQYESQIKSGKLTTTVYKVNGENANVYTGELQGSNKLQGIFAILKIRDKTAVIQTDAMVFEKDFYNVLDSVTYKS